MSASASASLTRKKSLFWKTVWPMYIQRSLALKCQRKSLTFKSSESRSRRHTSHQQRSLKTHNSWSENHELSETKRSKKLFKRVHQSKKRSKPKHKLFNNSKRTLKRKLTGKKQRRCASTWSRNTTLQHQVWVKCWLNPIVLRRWFTRRKRTCLQSRKFFRRLQTLQTTTSLRHWDSCKMRSSYKKKKQLSKWARRMSWFQDSKICSLHNANSCLSFNPAHCKSIKTHP